LKWFEENEVTHIAMESTGVYWEPIYNILEGFFDITLANAQRIKNVTGRKTDVCDAEWFAKLLGMDYSKRALSLQQIFEN
jgi:transposase